MRSRGRRWVLPPLLLLLTQGQPLYEDPFCESCAEMGDPFGVLGLEFGSNRTEVRRACRELKVRYHPDKNLGREKEVAGKFSEVSGACEALGEKQKEAYDEFMSKAALCQKCASAQASLLCGKPRTIRRVRRTVDTTRRTTGHGSLERTIVGSVSSLVTPFAASSRDPTSPSPLLFAPLERQT